MKVLRDYNTVLTISEGPCKRHTLEKNFTVHPELADYAVGEKVTLTCLKATRYALFGDKEVSCLSSGEWSGSPYCRKTGKTLYAKL